MEVKTKNIIFLFVLVVYSILVGILKPIFYPNLYDFLYWISFGLLISYIFWFGKNTSYFQVKNTHERLKVFEETGVLSAIILICFFMGVFSILLGFIALFSCDPDKFKIALSMLIMGIIVIVSTFFLKSKIRK